MKIFKEKTADVEYVDKFKYVIVHGCSCCCCLCFELPASAIFQPTVSPKTGRLQRWKCFRRKKSTLYLDLSAPEVNYDLKKM